MLRKSLPLLAIIAISLSIISAAICYTNARAVTSISAEAVDIAAVKTNVESSIATGKMAGAKAQFETLLANADTDPEAVPVIYDLAEKFRFANNFETALQGHQYILDHYPSHKDAILAQKSLAATYIWAGDIKSAEAVTDEMYEKFAGNERLGESAFWVADTYYWRNFFKPAQKYYDKVIETFPGTKAAMSAQRAIATMCMAQGDEEGAQSAIDAYMANYGHMEGFAQEMMLIAGRYGWDKKYEKAFEYYDYIAKYYPEADAGKLAGFESSKAKVKMLLNANDEPNAIVAIDELIAKYAKDEALKEITSKTADKASFDQSLMEIAKQLGNEKRYDCALKYYDYMAANLTDEALVSDASLEADRLRVIRLADAFDEAGTLAAIESFLATHGQHARVADVTLEFAQYYNWKNAYEPNELTALLLNKVIDTYPDKSVAQKAKIDLLAMDAIAYENNIDDPKFAIEINNMILDSNLSPYMPSVFYKAGKCFYDRRDYNSALAYFEHIRQSYPDQEFAEEVDYLRLSGKCCERFRLYDEAIEIYKKFLEKYPANIYAKNAPSTIGEILRWQDKFDEAIFWLDKQQELYPYGVQAERALFNQGAIYLRELDDAEKAKKIFERYLSKYPDGQRVIMGNYNLAVCNRKLNPCLETKALEKEAYEKVKAKAIGKDSYEEVKARFTLIWLELHEQTNGGEK